MASNPDWRQTTVDDVFGSDLGVDADFLPQSGARQEGVRLLAGWGEQGLLLLGRTELRSGTGLFRARVSEIPEIRRRDVFEIAGRRHVVKDAARSDAQQLLWFVEAPPADQVTT